MESACQSTPIYHHTDYNGLVGILSNATFRFSAIEYLNDSAERTYLLSYISERLNSAKEKYKDNHWALRLIDHMSSENRLLPTNYYIGCFTEAINDLGQWRGYSRTVPSYALKFNREALIKVTKEIAGNEEWGAFAEAGNVTYCGPSRSVSFIDSFIQGRINSVLRMEANSPNEKNSSMDSYVMNLGDALSLDLLQKHYPAFYKNEAFHSEREFRIAIRYSKPSHGKRMKFGITAGVASLKPYIEIDYGEEIMRSLVEQVIVGPTSEEKIACRALEQYRDSLGYSFEVEYCRLPFRPGW